MEKVRRSLSFAVLSSALLLGVTGCAVLAPAKPEDVVAKRAQARWSALLAGNLEEAYGYLLPSYRAVTTVGQYRGRFGAAVSWTGAKVHSVSCSEPGRCEVRVIVSAKPILRLRPGQEISTTADEVWLLEDGVWGLFVKR